MVEDPPEPGEPPAEAAEARSPPERAALTTAAPTDSEELPRSRAREYRERRHRRRAPWKWTVVEVVVLIVIVVALYLATAPTPSKSAGGPPSGGDGAAAVQMTFGNPTVGSTTCGTSGNYSTESFRIDRTTQTLYTNQVALVVEELGDGDIIQTVSAPPVITAGAVCAGSPPTGVLSWYGVLVAPSGSNLASFTFSQGWSPVSGAQYPGPIMNGSSMSFVFSASVAGYGYGFYVSGVEGGPTVSGEGLL